MATEKVLTINSGAIEEKEIQSGEALELAFLVADGSSDPVPINADNTLPFLKADGTPSNIPLAPLAQSRVDMVQVQVFS